MLENNTFATMLYASRRQIRRVHLSLGRVWQEEHHHRHVDEDHGRGAVNPGMAKTGDKKSKFFGACFGPKRQLDGLSRCHGWIGEAKMSPWDLSRAPTDVWDPFFGHFVKRFEGFSNILKSRTRNLLTRNLGADSAPAAPLGRLCTSNPHGVQ